MTSDVPLDYAVFQLSPRRSRCELFVSYDGTTEKLASGLVKPFVTHLKVAEEQVALAVKSIKLEVERYKNAETWFTKGTLERFVRFVSTPEVLEMVNTFDAEMSQLEAARSIYSQGVDDHQSSASGVDGAGATAASDATKKELLRAIDVRLAAVKQDLTTVCTHASAAGFGPESVLELQHFADRFGAHRLSEACSKFIELSHRRPDLFNSNNKNLWKSSSDRALRSSTSSDMSLDSPSADLPKSSTSKVTFPLRRFSREPSPSPVDESEEGEDRKDRDKDKVLGRTTTSTDTSMTESEPSTQSSQRPQLTRRLSVQERISLFESKQKENSPSTATRPSSASTGVKPELRLLSSGVTSSADKALLRRWSGVSDMSIDVSGERKETDGNVSMSTPTPTSSSNLHNVPPKSMDMADFKGEEGDKDKDPTDSKLPVVLKEQPPSCGGVRSRAASFGRIEDLGLENQTESVQTQFKSKPWKNEQFGSTDQMTSQEKEKGPSSGGSRPQKDTGKDFGASNGNQDEAEGDMVSEQFVPRSQFRPAQKRRFKVAVESTASETPSQTVIQNKGGEADFVPETRLQGKDFESESCSLQIENSGSLRSMFQGHGPLPEQVKKLETQEVFSSTSVEPMDQVQRVRQSKGNQELHDELIMKANELEKLFAQHNLRVPTDQSNSARRTSPTEAPKEQEGSSINRKPVVEASPAHLTMDVDTASGSSKLKFSSTPLMKAADNQDYDITPKHNMYSLSFSDDSRGKSYGKYMQKRDAKLREDWSSKRAEKEAKMNAMQDRLEKSRAEMMAKLAGSADKRNSAHDARRRAEKLRSFNARSAMKREQRIDSFVSDEDEDRAEFLAKKLSQTFLGDSSSKSAQSKKVIPNKNPASSTPRNSAAPVPRSSRKPTNSATGRRRLNSDNPLAQSVPNFSDLRKENTKPSSGGSRPVRPQGRNNSRKKNSNEDLSLVSEEKPRRSQSLRKRTANPMELNDSCNSDNGRSNASVMIEAVRNGHDLDDVNFETEEMTDVAREEEDDFETTMGGESADMDNGKERLSQESDKSANSRYENSHALGFSEAGPASAPELPTSIPSLFRAMGSIQDSPGESPGSWNSGLQNPFSFHHEISDIDASDSPLGSPASWNFHSLAHTEADAARMRKKWGAAQKPLVGTDSSHSRKDVSKGLKWFLKFGRKNRASESLADWISATTSEGDDDTEDGRDPAYRSSEDLRKSRMGFTHSHHSDDGFNETDLFNEQAHALQSSIPTPPANFKLREEHLSESSLKAPKSFFSLSNFRSKGSDSKLR